MRYRLLFVSTASLCLTTCQGLVNKGNVERLGPPSRRSILQGLVFSVLPIPAVADEGISAVTDSVLGQSVRRSAVRGAQIIDRLDESWERYSDSRRDKQLCDPATGRRLFDNGFRRDGTRVGNPVLGARCEPVPLQPVDSNMVDLVVNTALQVSGVPLEKVQSVEELVKASFMRDIEKIESIEDRKRKEYNFRVYTTLRAIHESKPGSNFELLWGQTMLKQLAPESGRRDYVSPFPEMKDELEDYDYDKDTLLDGLGSLTVALNKLQAAGLVSAFEISIPYDDYGTVITVAADDDVSIGAELLLQRGGPVTALIRAALDKGQVLYSLDTFYVDPTTTKQSEYNPTQLLASVSNVRRR